MKVSYTGTKGVPAEKDGRERRKLTLEQGWLLCYE
jgi:hypothetical protein